MKIPKPKQLPSGNWRVRVYTNGHSVSHTAETEEAAFLWAQSYKETYKKNQNQKSEYEKILKGIAKSDDGIKIDPKILPTVATELKLVDNMDGLAFERYAKNLFQMTGFFHGGSVHQTQGTGDFGADIVIECLDGNRISIQCKRLKSSVGIKSVQEVVASKKHYRTNAAGILTNSYFTQAAKELAYENGVALFDRKQLVKLIKMKIATLDKVYNRNQWSELLQALDIVK